MNSYALPPPSPFLEGGFYLLAIVVALSLPAFTWKTTKDRTWTGGAAFLALGWMALTGLLTQWSGFRSFELPPPFLLTVVTGSVLVTLLVFGPFGSKTLGATSLAGLVLFQSFRFPLELLMHRAYAEGLMPVQMSYDGRNLDILTGMSALILGSILYWRPLPKGLIWIWNLAGFGLLVNIVGVAILSTPVPFRQFHNDPPNVLVLDVPFVWLPTVMVLAALFGHLAIARKLLGWGLHDT